MRRAAMVIPNLRRGGAETLVVQSALEIARRGKWTPEVWVLQANGTLEEHLKGKVRVRHLNLSHRYDLTSAWKLRGELNAERFDVVHAHLFPANLLVALAHPSCVCVASEHSVSNRRRKFPLFRRLDRFVYSRFDRVVAVSGMVSASLEKWGAVAPEKVSIILNGIRISAESAARKMRSYRYDLLAVGNFRNNSKGIDVLLYALSRFNGIRVAIAGEGKLRKNLEALRDQLGLWNSVDFLGSVSNVAELMQCSRVFVMPSRWEGLPMALLEAMNAGLPIVASRVGGIPEALEHVMHGLLVAPENVTELSAALSLLLADENMQQRFSAAARERVRQKFSIEAHVDSLLSLYDSLLASGNTQSETSALEKAAAALHL